jgi:hypothetical protein
LNKPVEHDGRPDFLVTLGILLPCSEEDVKQAYRSKVHEMHPDTGGDAETFKQFQEAYQRALEYARFHGSRRQWLAQSVENYIVQEALVERIHKLGGEVTLQCYEWLIDEIGEDYAHLMERLIEIRLNGPEINDRDLKELLRNQKALVALQTLDLTGSGVTNQGVLKLAAFRSLRELRLGGTKISGSALAVIDDLPKLELLDLRESRTSWLSRRRLRWKYPVLEVLD